MASLTSVPEASVPSSLLDPEPESSLSNMDEKPEAEVALVTPVSSEPRRLRRLSFKGRERQQELEHEQHH